MRIVHGFITLVAALVVIVMGGTWLMARYEVGPDTGIWSPDYRWFSKYGRVPVQGPAKLSVPLRWMRLEFTPFGAEAPLVPVSVGSPDSFLGFNMHSRGDNGELSQGGSCSARTVNLVRTESEPAKPVFGRRVLLPHYAYFQNGEEKLVFALVIADDTDGDGYFSCTDVARLRIIRLGAAEAIEIDRDFMPDDLSAVDYDIEKRQLSFIERKYVGKGIEQKTLVINFAGEIVSEDRIPDYLSAARQAFERTGSD